MSDILNDSNEQPMQETKIQEDFSAITSTESKTETKHGKKKLAIIGGIVAALAIVAVVAIVLFVPSKFDRVKKECKEIAGSISAGKGYFTIETIPDSWDDFDPDVRDLLLISHQQDALDAMKHANEELGFPGVYSLMMSTTALMGRQSEENKKYKVTWSYHPDDGLTATYSER